MRYPIGWTLWKTKSLPIFNLSPLKKSSGSRKSCFSCVGLSLHCATFSTLSCYGNSQSSLESPTPTSRMADRHAAGHGRVDDGRLPLHLRQPHEPDHEKTDIDRYDSDV